MTKYFINRFHGEVWAHIGSCTESFTADEIFDAVATDADESTEFNTLEEAKAAFAKCHSSIQLQQGRIGEILSATVYSLESAEVDEDGDLDNFQTIDFKADEFKYKLTASDLFEEFEEDFFAMVGEWTEEHQQDEIYLRARASDMAYSWLEENYGLDQTDIQLNTDKAVKDWLATW